MRSTLEHDDREFLAELRKGGRSTVQSLCDRLGVTATAIRQRLARLQAAFVTTQEEAT